MISRSDLTWNSSRCAINLWKDPILLKTRRTKRCLWKMTALKSSFSQHISLDLPLGTTSRLVKSSIRNTGNAQGFVRSEATCTREKHWGLAKFSNCSVECKEWLFFYLLINYLGHIKVLRFQFRKMQSLSKASSAC